MPLNPYQAPQSGRLSGFGFGKQTGQGVQAALTNRLNGTSWDANIALQPIVFETLNGSLDSEFDTRTGLPDITGQASAPGFTRQGSQLTKGAIGQAIVSGGGNTSFGTLTASTLVNDTSFACTVPAVVAGTYDWVGAWLDIGGANPESVPVLAVSGNTVFTTPMQKVHTSGDSVTMVRAVAFVPNTGSNRGTLDFFSAFLQYAAAFERQYIDLQVAQLGIKGAQSKIEYAYSFVSSADLLASYSVMPAPTTPVPTTATTGGTVLAGWYGVAISYVNANGETVGSGVGTVQTTGTTSTVTVPSPAASTVNGLAATGWYAYVTQLQASSAAALTAAATRQQAAGSPTAIGTGLTLTAPPTSTGAATPTVSTASTLSALSYGSGESSDSAVIMRDGGLYSYMKAGDTAPSIHDMLTTFDYSLQYKVQKDETGSTLTNSITNTLASRTQKITWTVLAGGRQPYQNTIYQDYVKTGTRMPIILAFKHPRTGDCWSLVMPSVVMTMANPVGPTDNPISWNFEGKPLIDPASQIAMKMWLRRADGVVAY